MIENYQYRLLVVILCNNLNIFSSFYRLFDEWERRAALEEERRNAAKAFNDRCTSLEMTLSEFEKHIIKVIFPLPLYRGKCHKKL